MEAQQRHLIPAALTKPSSTSTTATHSPPRNPPPPSLLPTIHYSHRQSPRGIGTISISMPPRIRIPYICPPCLRRPYSTLPPRPPPSGMTKLTSTRQLISIHGIDATKFLQGLTTTNIPPLTTGAYSAFLTPQVRPPVSPPLQPHTHLHLPQIGPRPLRRLHIPHQPLPRLARLPLPHPPKPRRPLLLHRMRYHLRASSPRPPHPLQTALQIHRARNGRMGYMVHMGLSNRL